jgi:predicted ATP-dependent serine protease
MTNWQEKREREARRRRMNAREAQRRKAENEPAVFVCVGCRAETNTFGPKCAACGVEGALRLAGFEKEAPAYQCVFCGAPHEAYTPRCRSCRKSNSLARTNRPEKEKAASRDPAFDSLVRPIEWNDHETTIRTKTGLLALDAALGGGGGLAHGSSVVLTGEPGTGKTSLGMVLASAVENALLSSSEQSRGTIESRAKEMRLARGVPLICSRDLNEILKAARGKRFLGIDSLNELLGDPQENARRITSWAREADASVVCIAQLVSNGRIGGGSKIAYLFDTRIEIVRSSENDGCRYLRVRKNRYGGEGCWKLLLGTDGWRDAESGAEQVRPPAAVVPVQFIMAPPGPGERNDG